MIVISHICLSGEPLDLEKGNSPTGKLQPHLLTQSDPATFQHFTERGSCAKRTDFPISEYLLWQFPRSVPSNSADDFSYELAFPLLSHFFITFGRSEEAQVSREKPY